MAGSRSRPKDDLERRHSPWVLTQAHEAEERRDGPVVSKAKEEKGPRDRDGSRGWVHGVRGM